MCMCMCMCMVHVHVHVHVHVRVRVHVHGACACACACAICMCMCMHVHVFARTSVVGLGRLFRGWRQDSVCLPWDGASSGRVEAGLVRGACRSSCEHRAHSPRSHREGCTWRYQRVNTSIHVTVKAFSALFHVKECGEILRRNSVFLLNVKECGGIGYFNIYTLFFKIPFIPVYPLGISI